MGQVHIGLLPPSEVLMAAGVAVVLADVAGVVVAPVEAAGVAGPPRRVGALPVVLVVSVDDPPQYRAHGVIFVAIASF